MVSEVGRESRMFYGAQVQYTACSSTYLCVHVYANREKPSQLCDVNCSFFRLGLVQRLEHIDSINGQQAEKYYGLLRVVHAWWRVVFSRVVGHETEAVEVVLMQRQI